MDLIHFEGLFEIIYYLFDKGVLGQESSEYFLWTYEMQEYTLFDFESEMIMCGGNLYKHNGSKIYICHIGVHALQPQ